MQGIFTPVFQVYSNHLRGWVQACQMQEFKRRYGEVVIGLN